MSSQPGNVSMRLDMPPEQYALLQEAADQLDVGPYLFLRAMAMGAIRLGTTQRCFEAAVAAGMVTPSRRLRRSEDVLHWRNVTRSEHWSVTVESHTFDLIRQGSPGQHVKAGDGWYLFAPDVMAEPRFFGSNVVTAKRDADAFILRTVRGVQNGGTDVDATA